MIQSPSHPQATLQCEYVCCTFYRAERTAPVVGCEVSNLQGKALHLVPVTAFPSSLSEVSPLPCP